MDRDFRWIRCGAVALACFWLTSARLSAEEAGTTGTIAGVILDASGEPIHAATGEPTHVGKAVVFLCDAESGMPLSAKTRRVIEPGLTGELFGFDGFWHAVTGDGGGFELRDVPPGKYRLFAQSWAGISGMARGMPKSLKSDPGEEPSAVLFLHGVAQQVEVSGDEITRVSEEVEVKPGEMARVFVRPWGHESLRIVTDPEEPHNYLVISRNAPLGEGVLGPWGWGHGFIAGAVGVTRMENSHVTIVGLPEGAEVHVGLFNYDNSAGLGGATFVVGKDRPARLPIYAGWSNGKYEPTERLKKLTGHLATAKVNVEELTGIPDKGWNHWSREEFTSFWKRANDMIEVEGYGQAKLIDVVAAESYREMMEHRAKRQQRRGVEGE